VSERLNPAMRKRERWLHVLPSFLHTLKHNTSHANPTTSSKLQASLGIDDATVRAIAHELRTMGEPIGSGNRGFYYAQSADELDATIEHLQSRVNSINEILRLVRATQVRVRTEPTKSTQAQLEFAGEL